MNEATMNALTSGPGMVPFATYVVATGQIIGTGTCPHFAVSNQCLGPVEAVYEGVANLNDDYIVDGVLTPRLAMSVTFNQTTVAADATDAIVITDIPEGATAYCFGRGLYREGVVTGGTLTLSFFKAGEYRVELHCFPYKKHKEVIHAI